MRKRGATRGRQKRNLQVAQLVELPGHGKYASVSVMGVSDPWGYLG